jgi:hypothetical protein
MSLLKRLCAVLITGLIVVGGAELAARHEVPGAQSLIPAADARIGRPLTPISVAGVARRSVRRCAVGVYVC